MTLERERNPLDDLDGGEEAPTAQQARLAGREPHVLKGQQAVIVKYEAMNHGYPRKSIVSQKAAGDGRLRVGGSDWDAAIRRLFPGIFGERRNLLLEVARYFFSGPRVID